jgi:hypothetical protein
MRHHEHGAIMMTAPVRMSSSGSPGQLAALGG